MKMYKTKGSMLAVTMIILGIVLFVSLSVSLVSMRERRASIGSGKSNSAFQTADTGVEKVMAEIMGGAKTKANELSGCDNSSGLIEGDGYKVELKVADGSDEGTENDPVKCNNGSISISDIVAIKSVGQDSGNNQQRAIEAAVAGSDGEYQSTFAYDSFMDTNGNSKSSIVYCRTRISTGEVKCARAIEGSSPSKLETVWEVDSLGKTKYNTDCITAAGGTALCCRIDLTSGEMVCKKPAGSGWLIDNSFFKNVSW